MLPTSSVAAADHPRGAVAVEIDDVHIRYRIYEERRRRLGDVMAGRTRTRASRIIHAVRGVTTTIHSGEAIGLIGPNGSGKSSLLRAVAGLMPVDSGVIRAVSRPTLLGVGAVLRPELSGRRNIQIGLLAKGVPWTEVQQLEDQVIAFADLGEFIDLPLKAYSSGMRARLHFAIATVDRPDILMIDEALAVGDQAFRERSKERLAELTSDASCVIVVSHNLGDITSMCTRAIWLQDGAVVADGDATEVVTRYSESV